MNGRKAKIILIASILFIFSLILLVISKYNKKDVILNERINKNKSISIMLETDANSGVYEVSEDDEWPDSGYRLNTTRSGCENGSTISYDTSTNKVVIKGKISDKCYVFFDIIPPDLAVRVTNLPETYGKTATVSTTGASAIYNNKLNQIEISSFTADSVSLSLTYANPTGTTPLNNYIIGLAGTTQGDGKVIHEIGEIGDYTTTTLVTSYGTTPVYFENNSNTSTTQTRTGNYWTFNSSTGVFTSDPSLFQYYTSYYYHVYAQIPSAGFYKICYTIAQANSNINYLRIGKNSLGIITASSSSSGVVGETCEDIGYFFSNDFINISEYSYDKQSSPIMSFKLLKASNSTTFDTGYRYEGENPNNYVAFNNELWRIIGVFSTEYDTNGDTTPDTSANLVKIIRNEPIGAYSWDNNYSWYRSSIYYLLNNGYYDWELYKNNVSSYCYGYNASFSTTCDYSIIGIKDEFRDMITNSKWYLNNGGINGYRTYTPDNLYSYERDNNVTNPSRQLSILGYIGLMYGSDYLYGALESDCSRDVVQGDYGTPSCAGKNWLFGQGDEWNISMPYNANYSGYISGSGSVGSYTVAYGLNVRPTLYLSPSVYKIAGTGTITDPYIIGM